MSVHDHDRVVGADPDYLHALDGRLRIKVPEVKGCTAAAADVEALLGTIDGVESVTANPRTGNVLVLYDSQRAAQPWIIAALRTAGYLRRGHGDGGALRDQPWSHCGTVAGVVFRASVEFALQRLITALI